MAKKDDVFSDENIIPSNWVSWGTPVEDKIFGTLIRKFKTTSNYDGKEKTVENYELKADFGSYHKLDDKKNPVEPAIEVVANEFYNIGGKDSIEKQMRNIKVGQKIGFKFIEETPSKVKGHAPAKIIKVFAPKNDDGSFKMDEEWLSEQGSDLNEEFDK